jgi:tetratricopeptide (TPR) repeat protein
MNMRPIVLITAIIALAAATRSTDAQQASAPAAARAQVALLIGNAKYPDSETPLKEPVNDARALADELRRSGFDVEIGENLTREAAQRTLTRFYEKIRPGSVALIYFSGYGVQSNRQSYMLPVDAQIWAESDVRRDGLSLDATLAEMHARGASVKIAVVDASRRNPFERRFRSVPSGLAPVVAPAGALVLYSAAPSALTNNSAADRGMFSDELIKNLRTPGLSGEEVFNRTRMAVSRASRGEQVPWFSSSSSEDFSFNRAAGPAIAATTPAAVVVAPPPPPAPAAIAPPAPAPAPAVTAPAPGVAAPIPAAPRPPTPAPPPPAPAPSATAPRPPAPAPPPPAPAPTARLDTPAPPPVPAPAAPVAVKTNVNEAVIADLNRRIAQNPKDAAAYYKRGQEFAKGGDYSRAVKDFDETLKLTPKDADAFNNRCWANAIIGDLQAALKDCNEALQIRPKFMDALDSRGLVNLKLGLAAYAISDYDAVLQIDPKQAASLYGRGVAKLRSGNKNGGDSDIAAAKTLNPNIAEEFAGYGVR